jgi:hypothetical protein
MAIRFSHTPPNFSVAFMLAPFAGALAAFAMAAVWSPVLLEPGEFGVVGMIAVAGFVSLYALGLCIAYTAVVGTGVLLFVRGTGRVPRRSTAILVGILVGFVPFAAFAVSELREQYAFETSLAARASTVLLTPTIALAASLATAIAFWRLGLKGRRPAS